MLKTTIAGWIVGTIVLLMIVVISLATSASVPTTTEKISAAGFIAIRTAAQALESKGVPVDGYAIVVEMSETAVNVSFGDPKGCAPGTLGNCGDMPGFEVLLTPDGKQVVNAHFVR